MGTHQTSPRELLPTQEIVVGLVAPVGTELTVVSRELADAFSRVGYQSQVIRLTDLLRRVKAPEVAGKLRGVDSDGPAEIRIQAHMDAGDELRQLHGNDAMARLAIRAIRHYRKGFWERQGRAAVVPNVTVADVRDESLPSELTAPEATGGTSGPDVAEWPPDRFAYVLHQLKRREEVDRLRSVYGPAFILVAVHTPREERVQNLARKIAETHHEYQQVGHRDDAERLIQRDENDPDKPHGQDVRGTFHRADVFVGGTSRKEHQEALERFVHLLFGDTLCTPSRDEQAMYHAHAASLRSSSLGRQVGAAITTAEGDLVAVGANEVPKPGGGQYWAGDPGDHRDHVLGYDPSDKMKREVLADILGRLQKRRWLSEERSNASTNALVKEALETGDAFMGDAHFMNLVEFMRPVHAEMAALCDAARRGVPLAGCTLYVTAFPCHGCAKHIVATGLRRVVYVEPYPKSLASDMYRDSIDVEPNEPQHLRVQFDAFVGVAPRRFADWFTMGERKSRGGDIVAWDGTKAQARLGDWTPLLDITDLRERFASAEVGAW